MAYPPIVKDPALFRRSPNLPDYNAVRASFDWTAARALLDGLPAGRGLNIAHEAVDRHAQGRRSERVALRWLGKSGERQEFTYRQLAATTNRFANALQGLGLGAGSRIFLLLGRVPELYIALLGALKAKCVVSPLFSAKPDPMAGEIVKAFVALNRGFAPSEELRRELLGHARRWLGAAVAPKEIDFRANLPKTRSGKIMRRLLKARELGLPEGDLSTLESDER